MKMGAENGTLETISESIPTLWGVWKDFLKVLLSATGWIKQNLCCSPG